jgi:hypothetical protein
MLLHALFRPRRPDAKLQMNRSAIGEAGKHLTDMILKCRTLSRIDVLQ